MKHIRRLHMFLSAFGIFLLAVAPSAYAAFSGVLPVASAGSPASVVITLSSYSLIAGQTATVTFTFPIAPTTFTSSNITASNGTISNLAVTGDPKIYTATFTPTAQISSLSNTISVDVQAAIANYTGVGSGTSGISFDGTNMWASNGYDNSITKITQSGTLTNYTGLGTQPFSLAFDGTNMWTGNNAGSSVSKVTPSGSITTYSGIGTNVFGIAFDGTNMWTANYSDNSVSKVAANGTKTTYTGTGSSPWGIAFDGTNMWTANSGSDSVTKITSTGTMTTYPLGAGTSPIAIAFDGTNMWTGNVGTSTVSKITASGVVTSYATPSNAYGIAFDGTNMWTANYGASTVSRITPSGTVTEYSGVGSNPKNIAFDGTNLWTANLGSGSVSKITPIGAGVSSNYTINTLTVPVMTTGDASLSAGVASLTGVMSSTGGASPTVRGFNYGPTSNYGSVVSESGSFSSGSYGLSLTSLRCGTVYYYQSFATNSIGTATGNEGTFTTAHCPGGHAALVVPPAATSGNLDFAINAGADFTPTREVSLSLNADPAKVTGYAVSLDPAFTDSGIRPYTAASKDQLYTLPQQAGTYTVYLEYFSSTGMRSAIFSHTITYSPGKTMAASKNTSGVVFSRTLSLGATGSDVAALQKILVREVNLVLPEGTQFGYFGKTTKAALGAFQEKYAIATKGGLSYGIFGPKTRAQATKLVQ